MRSILVTVFLLVIVVLLNGCNALQLSQVTEDRILLNQEGYFTDGVKYVLVIGSVSEFSVVTETGDVILSGGVPSPEYWPYSGDSVSVLDLTNIKDSGHYVIKLNGQEISQRFTVSDEPFKGLDRSAIKAFYLSRSGMAIDSAYAGQWARPGGHPDTAVMVHASAASPTRPEGIVIFSPQGCYDAGDYNKYIVNSGITTFTLLQALQDYRGYFEALDCNIPESGNALPDLLDELLYNLRWMLTMQDPADGGVYHKLTTKRFAGMVMPNEATNQRYVVQKGAAATLDFAAVCAKAARVLQPWEEHLPGLIDSCHRQAELAWEWALENPDVKYEQAEYISIGAYGDESPEDEFYWAACEMCLIEKNERYLPQMIKYFREASVPAWNNVGTLGTISMITSGEALPAEVNDWNIEGDFIAFAAKLVKKMGGITISRSIDKFAWGSNSIVANEGMLKLIMFKKAGMQKYFDSALSDFDYILGRNATSYCFVTGFG